MKYIDADKLVAEIKRYKNKADNRLKIKGRNFSEEQKDLALQNLCGNLLHFITSIQQEQPEVDLEEEIAIYLRTFSSSFENGIEYTKNIARRFYELGLNARNEK